MLHSSNRTRKNQRVHTLCFDLAITRDQFLRFYRGQAKSVITQAHSGETLQFPASGLRAFVGRDGVQGTFCIHYTEDGTLINITRNPGV